VYRLEGGGQGGTGGLQQGTWHKPEPSGLFFKSGGT
jgi:hypothetical protein